MKTPAQVLAAEYSLNATAYAHYWAPVIHPMASPLLQAMPLESARRILDVGSGSGGLWPFVQQRAPRAELFGVDRAAGMLTAGAEILRGRAAVMDAEQLGFRAMAFDAALLLFVLFHIQDPLAALREVHTILKPSGSLGIVVWGKDPGLPGASIWTEELDRLQAAPDDRDSAVMRHAMMDAPAKVTGLIELAGLASSRVWSQEVVHLWTVESLLATQSHCGPPSRRLRSLPTEDRQACLDRVRRRIGGLTEAELCYRVQLVYAIARRPA